MIERRRHTACSDNKEPRMRFSRINLSRFQVLLVPFCLALSANGALVDMLLMKSEIDDAPGPTPILCRLITDWFLSSEVYRRLGYVALTIDGVLANSALITFTCGGGPSNC